MIKPKKPIAFVCAAALLLSPTGALGASPSDFVDFPNDWSTGAMTAAVDNGLLGGVDGEHIAPQGVLTRAQMAAIINRAFGAEKTASLTGYTDVAANAWYATDMAKAVQMGTFSGSGNGLLEPDRAITREEAFSVLARAFALSAGDGAALNDFTDGAQVSAWARGSVSAMVAGGYVNGSDGNRLNPQQTITRAEFAAVMSKIVAQYIDADSTLNRSLEIDGNVIVRGNVDLSGYTINGDVIIADEATNVTLDGVTVNGRLVVRGASDSLTISGSSADGVIITNPNGASVLKTDNASDLGTVTALGDLTLSGGQLDRLTIAESATITVEKGASVETITVSADDVTINGAGKVDKVQANADNVHVNVEDAEVTAGKGTSGVTAGDTSVAPGESATVSGDSDSDNDNENTGSNTGNGGSSGGNNNNPGGSTDTPGTDNPGGGNDNPGTTPGGGESTGDNTNPGGSEETPAAAIINAETTKLVDLGWSQYVTVQFTKGHTLENTILTIDGTDVTDACTPVTDDGSIVKWEITDLNPAQLVATSAGESQTDTLSGNASPKKPKVVTDSAPDYMIAHGPVAVWDYHLTNYDKDGNVRIEPSKTTFNISGETATDVPAFYSADAELHEGDGHYGVSGTVTIEFAQESDADKAWFAAVPANKTGTVQLVADNENQNVIADNLSYTKNDDGTITIPLGQENFYSNGRYNVSIYSDGHDPALVPIHVVNAQAPSLSLTGSGSFKSGENIHFAIKDMTYGATAPIYAVELTRPDNTTVSLEKFTDWGQIDDSLVLYNDNTNNTLYNGTYTITVHSNGFKDMSLPFTITGGTNVPTAASRSTRSLNVDAVSRATSGGGSSESGGSGAVSANLKFDADLLINAQILVDMGLANDAAKGIADRWQYEMSGWDQVYSKTDAENAYDWGDYITKVNQARTRGEYLSFAEYTENAADWDLTGAPYAVKSVLEDNLLGEAQLSGTWKGQQTPTVTLVDESGKAIDAVKEGSDAYLKFSDAAYLKKLDSLNINSEPFDMDKTLYSVNGDTLIIKNEALDFGTNNLVIYADGYRAKYVNIRYDRNLETGLSLSGPGDFERGSQARIEVTGSSGDYLKNLTAVTVYKPRGATERVFAWGAGNYDDEYYQVSNDNVLIIVDNNGNIFDENGTYTIALDAQYYNRLTTEKFTVTGKLNTAPSATSASKDESGNYIVHFDDSNAYAWQAKWTGITVNDKIYREGDTLAGLNKNQYTWTTGAYGGHDLTLQENSFNKDGDSTITITAEGYEPLIIEVTAEGQLVDDSTTEPGGDTQPAPAAPTATVDDNGNVTLAFNNLDSTWQGKITSIKVNEQVYAEFTGSYSSEPGNNEYNWQYGSYGQELYLDKTSFEPGANTVVISAEGYKDLTVTVNIEDPEKPPVSEDQVAPKATFEKSYGYGYLYFDKENNNSQSGKAYVDAITEISVNDVEFSEPDYGYKPDPGEYYPSSSSYPKYVSFNEKDISTTGDTTIVIKATGYKDLTVVIDKDGQLISQGSGEVGDSEQETGKDAPSVSSTTKDYYDDYVLYFENLNDDAWASSVSSGRATITVNRTTYNIMSSHMLSSNEYQWSSSGSFSYPELTLDATSFTEPENKIVISVEGYKDLTITIDKDGNIVE